jgi:Na+:H+ antiporter, NhaA family
VERRHRRRGRPDKVAERSAAPHHSEQDQHTDDHYGEPARNDRAPPNDLRSLGVLLGSAGNFAGGLAQRGLAFGRQSVTRLPATPMASSISFVAKSWRRRPGKRVRLQADQRRTGYHEPPFVGGAPGRLVGTRTSMSERDEIRLPWSRSDRPIPRRAMRPIQDFVSTSAAPAFVSLLAVAIALVWANGPWAGGYERFWSTRIVVRLGGWRIGEDLRFWVSEGLMTLFFLAAGLEIKRELSGGELRNGRAAAIPVLAAIGGMLGAGVVFLAITWGSPAVDGWGAALPTDLAFGLGILMMAARSAPPSLRAFLLSLAIVDDLLTIIVVALFYAEHVDIVPLVVAAAIAAAMVVCARLHVGHLAVYLILGFLAWLATYRAGVHPALVGAVVGLLAPASPLQRPAHVSERELVPWVNFVALPLFALANAGVRLTSGWTRDGGLVLVAAFVASRLIGKTVGVVLPSLAAGRGRGGLPDGAGLRELCGVGAAAGAPFAVSVFVAAVAFPPGSSLRAAAQVGVLCSLVVCGAASFVVLRPRSRGTSDTLPAPPVGRR